MIRGSTPTHRFTPSIDLSLIKDIELVYAQNDVVLITKHLEDFEVEDNTLILKLSQEETLKFSHKAAVQIQARTLMLDGSVLSTHVTTTTVQKCLSSEVLR